MKLAEELGFCAFAARGSRGVIDVVCFDTAERNRRAALVVQVGTAKKPVAAMLGELAAAPRPFGSLTIVARRMPLKAGRRAWRFTTPHGTFDTLEKAIATR